jgi:signal transduction histidine kinase
MSLGFNYLKKMTEIFVNIGIDESFGDFEKGKLQLINTACLVGEACCFCFILYDLLIEEFSVNEFFLFFLGLNFIVTHWLNYKNKYQTAELFAYYPVVVVLFLIAYRDALLSPYAATELAFIIYAIIGVLIYDGVFRHIAIVFTVVLFSVVKAIHIYIWDLPFDKYFWVNSFIAFCFFSVFLEFISYFKKSFITLLKSNKEIILKKEISRIQTENLQQINTTKDKLFSIIAHDLRGPIASVKAMLLLFENKSLTQEGFVELSKHLQQNIDNIHTMLENLLFWSLSQMEGITPNVEEIDLNDMIRETLYLMHELAKHKQIDLQVNLNKQPIIYADKDQIQTVFRNLIDNAIKFTPKNGKIVISVNNQEDFVLLKITDTGKGIKQEELLTIFTKPKLSRGTNGEKGTGLGLIICKDLIEQNGGTIAVSSEYEKGTTFEILLPTE